MWLLGLVVFAGCGWFNCMLTCWLCFVCWCCADSWWVGLVVGWVGGFDVWWALDLQWRVAVVGFVLVLLVCCACCCLRLFMVVLIV